jgi:uncharacterized protein
LRRVFLDTVGLLAVWDVADQWHKGAEAAMSVLMQGRCELFTSDAVLLECGNASARKEYRDDVIELRRNLLPAGRVVSPTTEELDVAWQAYERRLNAGAGIVDQISFVLIHRVVITEAFTNDEHFRAAGFVTLF